MKKEYETFLKIKSDTGPDATTHSLIKNQAKNYIQPKISKVWVKYTLVFLFSAVFSLALCPQKGLGLFDGFAPLLPLKLHNYEMLCGIYCGLVFFLTTHLVSLFYLNIFERKILNKKAAVLPVILYALSFGLFMWKGEGHLSHSTVYSLSWLLTVSMGVVSWFLYTHRKTKITSY